MRVKGSCQRVAHLERRIGRLGAEKVEVQEVVMSDAGSRSWARGRRLNHSGLPLGDYADAGDLARGGDSV